AEAAARSGKKAAEVDTTSAIEDFIKKNPDAVNSAKLRYQQAEGLMQTGDYIKASQVLEKVVKSTDDEELKASAYLDLAKAYSKTNHESKAVEAYQMAAQQYSGKEQANALNELGNISYERGNYESAADYYQQAVTNGNGKQLEARVGWGNALMAVNKGESAKEHYKEALNISNNYAPARVGLARIKLSQNNYAEAADLLNAIVSSGSGAAAAEAQYLLGKAYSQQSNYKKALDAFSKVEVLYEHNDKWVAKSIMGSAEAYIQLDQRVQARKMLQKLINRYP